MSTHNKNSHSSKGTNKRSTYACNIIKETINIFLKTEIECKNKLELFNKIFLENKTHSLEDMYLHQIEIPKVRKIIGYKTKQSLLSTLYKLLIENMQITISLLKEIQSDNLLNDNNTIIKISLEKLSKHIIQSIIPLLQGVFDSWEWILQAIDLWTASEPSFLARLPDYYEQFENNQGSCNINDLIDELLGDFFIKIANITSEPQVFSKQTYILRYLKSDSVLKNIFTLPIIRSLNYLHIFKLYHSLTTINHFDYLSINTAYESLRKTVKPIYKGIKGFNKILAISKSFPDKLKLNFIRRYRIVLFNVDIICIPKEKKKQLIICNDIIVFISPKDNGKHEFNYKIVPIPSDVRCDIINEQCQVRSPFGWIFWIWKSNDIAKIQASILRAKLYISVRNNILYNRSGASLDSLLPLELVKICDEISSSQIDKNICNTITISQMMEKILEKAELKLEIDIEKLNKADTKKDDSECSWIFEDSTSHITLNNLIELLDSDIGFKSFLEYSKRSYCSELVLFYKEVAKYIELTGTPEAEIIAKDIMKNYLYENSDYEINIRKDIKQKALNVLENKQYTYSVFDECKDCVIVLMVEDIFPSYLESKEFSEYRRLLEEKKTIATRKKKKRFRWNRI